MGKAYRAPLQPVSLFDFSTSRFRLVATALGSQPNYEDLSNETTGRKSRLAVVFFFLF